VDLLTAKTATSFLRRMPHLKAYRALHDLDA